MKPVSSAPDWRRAEVLPIEKPHLPTGRLLRRMKKELAAMAPGLLRNAALEAASELYLLYCYLSAYA